MYTLALSTNAQHANTLYNYAVMLDTHLLAKERAESLYRQCISVHKRHAFALYNLAVLLEERYCHFLQQGQGEEGGGVDAVLEADRKYREEVCALYRKAVEADPKGN